MLLINWSAAAPWWEGSSCALCIIQVALKACQLNYRSFTRNISCRVPRSQEKHLSSAAGKKKNSSRIQPEKWKTVGGLLDLRRNFSGLSLWITESFSSVAAFHLRVYVIISKPLFNFNTSGPHTSFHFGEDPTFKGEQSSHISLWRYLKHALIYYFSNFAWNS